MPNSIQNNPSDAFIRALTDIQTALRGYCQASLGHSEEAKEALQRTSAVFVDGKQRRLFFLYGILQCCESGFTKVSPFVPWLNRFWWRPERHLRRRKS